MNSRERGRTRVLIVTDRTELDEQIEMVFKGVDEDIYRTKSGADLVEGRFARPRQLADLLARSQVRHAPRKADIDQYVSELREHLHISGGLQPPRRDLRFRGRVPPDPVGQAAQGHEGDPARAPP